MLMSENEALQQQIVKLRRDLVGSHGGGSCSSSSSSNTNVENLKYSGISLNMENTGNSQGIQCNLREKL